MSTTEEVSAEFGTALRRRGAIVLAAFALVWAAAGLSGVAGGVAPVVGLVVATAVTASIVALAVRAGGRPGGPRRQHPRRLPVGWRKRVGRVNLTEFAGIAACVVLANLAGHPELIPPAVCFVVGVHFLPLARLFDQPQYTQLGAVLLLLASVGFTLCLAGVAAEVTRAVVGLGAAGSLWWTAVDLTARR